MTKSIIIYDTTINEAIDFYKTIYQSNPVGEFIHINNINTLLEKSTDYFLTVVYLCDVESKLKTKIESRINQVMAKYNEN